MRLSRIVRLTRALPVCPLFSVNSIRSLERALRHEEERQRAALEGGEGLVQETRHFDEERGTTHTLRSKEEAFDYRYFPVWVNKHTARYRRDGSVRVVVAHEDPRVADANWIDTCGHERGTMCWRWIRAQDLPQPQTRVVQLAQVRSGAV